jgi:hypothetical protein
MSAHTPGPWELRQSTRHGYWFIDYPQQEGSATLTKLDCDEADARLLAAAPDLLELARQIVLAAEQYESEIPSDIVAGAKTIIAKATGDQT